MSYTFNYRITGIIKRAKGSKHNLYIHPFLPFSDEDIARWSDDICTSYGEDDIIECTLSSGICSDQAPPEIVSIRKLASANSPKARVYKNVADMGYLFTHTPQAMAEVSALLDKPGIYLPSLKDLTHIPFVTIDNDDSKDLDQALHIEKSGAGYIVRYALADAAWYVRPGTSLFEEAIERGVTYYLPDFCLPMLPAELSEGLISLNEHVDRRALVFEIHLSPAGETFETNLFRGRIHSRAQLSYSGVQNYHDNKSGHPLSGHDYTSSLDLLEEVGEILMDRSKARGVVVYERFESYVKGSEVTGDKLSFTLDERTDVSRWNEQISLLCNTEGALFLRHCDIPIEHVQPVFRVHSSPDSEDMEAFSNFVSELATLYNLPKEQWIWDIQEKKTVADYLASLPRDGEYANITTAIERHLLITNQRSLFKSVPERHYALAVSSYSRFSSPMREMVGIFTHKEALEQLAVEHQPLSDEEDERLREEIIDIANKAKQKQAQLNRAVSQMAVDDLFMDDLKQRSEDRPVYNGIVLGIKPTRLYLRLQTPPVELKMYINDIEDLFEEPLKLSPNKSHILLNPSQGTNNRVIIKTGQNVSFKVKRFEKKRRKWHFEPLLT